MQVPKLFRVGGDLLGNVVALGALRDMVLDIGYSNCLTLCLLSVCASSVMRKSARTHAQLWNSI